MDRVKRIEEVIIGGGDVLIEMIETKKTKSGLILPDKKLSGDMDTSAYGIVVAVGAEVKDLEAGDIILKTRNEKAPGYDYKGKNLIMVSRYNIAVAIKKENFDSTDQLSA